MLEFSFSTSKCHAHRHSLRYEFRPNEFISTVKSVSLSSRSKASGRKDFIAVGTTVHRAEDLAARGGVSLADGFPLATE